MTVVQGVSGSRASLPASFNGFEDAPGESTLTWVDGTRTLTLAPSGTSFFVWVGGARLEISASQSVTVPNVTQLNFIYLDADGVLQQRVGFDIGLILTNALVAAVYWNVSQGAPAVYVADERHGLMDGHAHLHAHRAFGSQIWKKHEEGEFALTGHDANGNGDNNDSAWIACDGGALIDEDIYLPASDTSQVLGTPAASNPYTTPPTAAAQIPTLYRLDADPGEWFLQAASDYPMLDLTGTIITYTPGRHPFNELSGGNWALTEVNNNDFYLIHGFAVNDIRHRIVSVVGQQQYSTLGTVREDAVLEINQISEGGLPFPEFKPLWTMICQTSDGYANEPASRFRSQGGGSDFSYIDWRGLAGVPVAPVAS